MAEEINPEALTKKKKYFIPLENNPEVIAQLSQQLGVSSNLGFHDVYSIDDPDLLALIPRPVHALILICPAAVYHRFRATESLDTPPYDGCGEDEPVVWYRQTIGNSCGLMGLLHAVSNGARQYVLADSTMDGLLKEVIPLKPEARAQIVYDSAALEVAHMAAAQGGDTAAPPAEDHPDGHFICFSKGTDGHLWELEGGWTGPLDRGLLQPDEDVLSENGLAKSVRNFLANAKGDDLMFSLVAVAPNFETGIHQGSGD